MHDYMIKNKMRRKVNEILICSYLIAVFLVKYGVDNDLTNMFKNLIDRKEWFYIEDILSIILPGIGVGVVYCIYDKWGWRWRWVKKLHKVPDLNGYWKATVEAPLKEGRKPVIEMTIRQTWNKIQIYGKSQKKTETISDSAAIMEMKGGTYIGYSYWIHHKSEPSYPGFNMLRYEENKLYGDYYSDKDVTNDFIEILENMREEEAKKLREKLRGCGSKGYIILQRI